MQEFLSDTGYETVRQNQTLLKRRSFSCCSVSFFRACQQLLLLVKPVFPVLQSAVEKCSLILSIAVQIIIRS